MYLEKLNSTKDETINRIAPQDAALLAEKIYGVLGEKTLSVFLKNPIFSKTALPFSADAGSRLFNKTTRFGVYARGDGDFSNHLFIIFRGTDLKSSPVDAITDMRIGITLSETGQFVHSGFNQTFNSMHNDIAEFIHKHSDATTVHCVGHSLGGAVANLCADWVASKFQKTIFLYTFGSPRVGLCNLGFPNSLTHKLGKDNIKRMYHSNDPVPMVPVYPYAHAPTFGSAFYLPNGGSFIKFDAHDMVNYKATVGDKKWQELYQPSPIQYSIDSIKAGLTSSASDNLTDITTWHKINFALSWIAQGLLIVPGVLFTAGFTIADQLAMMLHKGIQLGGEISSWAVALIQRMMRMLGMAVTETIEALSEALIRMVLNRAINRIYEEVRKAINRLH